MPKWATQNRSNHHSIHPCALTTQSARTKGAPVSVSTTVVTAVEENQPYTGKGFQASESAHRVKWMESPSSHFVGGEEGAGESGGGEDDDYEGGHRSENEDDSRATYESGVRVHSAKR